MHSHARLRATRLVATLAVSVLAGLSVALAQAPRPESNAPKPAQATTSAAAPNRTPRGTATPGSGGAAAPGSDAAATQPKTDGTAPPAPKSADAPAGAGQPVQAPALGALPTASLGLAYSWMMVIVFVVLPVAFLFALHLVDSVQAYRFAGVTRDKALAALGGTLTAEQVAEISRISPTGISGTTRSIFTYGLLIVLGAAVFHLLTFSNGHDDAVAHADKILTVLAGALSSVIGFYFGSKATSEGVSSGAAQRPERTAKPVGAITLITPSRAAPGQEVRIEGVGFGGEGTVQFGKVSVSSTVDWTDTSIRVVVPPAAAKGATAVSVNPADGTKIVASEKLFEVI